MPEAAVEPHRDENATFRGRPKNVLLTGILLLLKDEVKG